MLSISQLECFIAVVDSGSFQVAAERLECSQPSISQQLRKLEEGLGVQLIVRNRQRSTLTQAGAEFLPHARSILSSTIRAHQRLKDRALVISASSNIGVYLAPRLIRSFADHSPRQAIRLQIGTNRSIIDSALSGEADLALTEVAEEHSSFESHSWRREKLIVIAAPDHPLAKSRRLGKRQILAHPIVGGESGTGTGRILRDFFGDDFVKLKIGMELGSTAAVKEAVKARLGISIVLACSVAEDIAYGSLIGIEFQEADLFKNLYAVCSQELPESSPARAFLKHVRAAQDAACYASTLPFEAKGVPGVTKSTKTKVVVTNRIFPETRRLLTQRVDVEENDSTAPWSYEEVRRRCRSADGLLAFMTDRIDADFLDECPQIKVIGAALKGYDNIDAEACRARDVVITIVPDLLTVPTAELAVGLMLALGRNILAGDRRIRADGFQGWRPSLYGLGIDGATDRKSVV